MFDPECAHQCHQPEKILVIYSVTRTTARDARIVRDLVIKLGLGGIILWGDGFKPLSCDRDVIDNIECLAFGNCPT